MVACAAEDTAGHGGGKALTASASQEASAALQRALEAAAAQGRTGIVAVKVSLRLQGRTPCRQQGASMLEQHVSIRTNAPVLGSVYAQVQYPDALQTMMADLSSIRTWAGFLQRTEIKFDMLSAVGELAKQAGALQHSLLTGSGACNRPNSIACVRLWGRSGWSLTSGGRRP